MMIRPEPAHEYGPIDLKLGIKSSLRPVKPTLALLFLIWREMGRPSQLEYASPQGSGIVLRDDIAEKLYRTLLGISGGITMQEFSRKVNDNLLFKAQLEQLLVAFELIWKVAKIRFSDGRGNGKERTGGSRFPKTVWFTLNMDLMDTVCGDDAEYDAVLFSWMGFRLPVHAGKERNLIRFFTAISENAYYKLSNNGTDIVFNTESVYKAVLSQNEPVDISDTKETKGPLRILKSALAENLFSYLSGKNSSVMAADAGALRDYAGRVAVFHELDPKTVYYTKDSPEPEPDEPTWESVEDAAPPINFSTGITSTFSRNRILFGAPGTGKSYTLNREKDILLADGGEYERVTFHPDYSYANFVGTYKPVPCRDSSGSDAITYSYVPGPFMRTYVKALKNSRSYDPKPFLLIIEEINRANTAAVFGDMFQLLDRGDDEVSEYPIRASEDMKKYLADELGGVPNDYAEMRIPDNMFLWATMNSADQGVFPLDTAFKRRWDFTYLGVDDGEAGIAGKKVVLGRGEYRRVVEWNELRKAINSELLLSCRVNEDKLMGPYFISRKSLPPGDTIDPDVFVPIFKNKVIMYLFDDAAKQKRPTLFSGCEERAKNQYSGICEEFDTKGVSIFCEAVSSRFIDRVPEDMG